MEVVKLGRGELSVKGDEQLPGLLGIMISYLRGPYQPISQMECKQWVFEPSLRILDPPMEGFEPFLAGVGSSR